MKNIDIKLTITYGRASNQGAGGMKLFSHIRSDRRGAAVAQYGLIAAVGGVAIAVAALAFGSAMTSELAASPPCVEVNRC